MSTVQANGDSHPAFRRVIDALEAHGRRPRVYGNHATAHCPGPGHWRGDVHPSLSLGLGDHRALVCCQAGCATEDVVAALSLTMADLFDEPRRPRRAGLTRGKAEDAVAASDLPKDEAFVMMMLLRRAHNDTLEVPAWRTPSLPELAVEVRVRDGKRMPRILAHLQQHRWVKYTAGRGRGHRGTFRLLPDGVPGDPCGCAKGGSSAPLFKQGKRVREPPFRAVKGGNFCDISPVQGGNSAKGYVEGGMMARKRETNTRWARVCAKCGEAEPGPGGILCPGCKSKIEARVFGREAS